jgi:hypothetical protein
VEAVEIAERDHASAELVRNWLVEGDPLHWPGV